MPSDRAVAALVRVCSSPGWAERLAAGRPYRDVGTLLTTARDALATLGWPEIEAALSGHPRMGERGGSARESSSREQAGLCGADGALLARLAAVNGIYERRFGHVHLVRASGRNARELVDLAERRLINTAVTEREIVRRELTEINEIRLRRLAG